MTPEDAKALREPFPSNAIGQLPKPLRKDAEKGRCNDCGGWHGLPAVHLDYVGHAAATDRLLAVDTDWTWEPFALTEQGLPALDRENNLWIRLTICGVTRPGVGDGASMKERIGDAIRNAAMRFGVALDLWAKEDLHDTRTQEECPPPSPPTEPPKSPLDRKRAAMFAKMRDKGVTGDRRREYIDTVMGRHVESSKDLTMDELGQVLDALNALDDVTEGS